MRNPQLGDQVELSERGLRRRGEIVGIERLDNPSRPAGRVPHVLVQMADGRREQLVAPASRVRVVKPATESRPADGVVEITASQVVVRGASDTNSN